MKIKLCTILLAVSASLGTMFASVTIDGIAYNLNESELTAEVTDGGNYSGNIVIPEKVTYNTKNYSVSSIRSYAFQNCEGLTSISIPNSVTSIGDYAFEGCTGLPVINDIRYADTYLVKAIGWSLSTYNILEGTKWIGTSAFSGCTGLTTITIPNSVINIGVSAFENCTSLRTITIPNSVTTIGNNAFYRCSSLPIADKIRYADTYLVEAIDKSLSTYNILEGTKWIGTSAFSGCTGLTTITIPNSVINIGVSAFEKCTSLRTITIPNSVTTIGSSAFADCSGLTTLTIPNGITSIGNHAFRGCGGLSFVKIPNSVTSIGYSAFQNCGGLTSVQIGSGVTTIEMGTFYHCTNLSSIIIPNSVKSIKGTGGWTDRGAFEDCSNLTHIYNYGTTPANAYSASFDGVNKFECTLYVPKSSIDMYKNAQVWRDFYYVKELDDKQSVNTIENGVQTAYSKILQNGHLYIRSNDKVYTITGQEVQ